MTDQKPSPELETQAKNEKKDEKNVQPKEIGGYADQGLLEPTRYGDWDVKGRCSDF